MKVAIQSVGGNATLSEVLSNRYVTDPKLGSTTEDLVFMAKDFNVTATVYQSLDIAALRSFKSPALLHLRTRADQECGGHWISFLGFEDDKIIVYDPSKYSALMRMVPADLLTRWSGHAVLVSAHALSVEDQFWFSYFAIGKRLFAVLICMAAVAFLAVYCKKWSGYQKFTTLVFASILTAAALQVTDQNGIAQNWLSAKWMTGESYPMKAASFDDFLQASEDGNLVDARTESASQRVKILGAKRKHQFGT
jgi:hypothetical protein